MAPMDFPCGEGPCVQSLDRVLKLMKIERQAYFGGAFVGNHVHKCLKASFFVYMSDSEKQYYTTHVFTQLLFICNINIFQNQNSYHVICTGREHKTPVQQFY